MGLISLFSIITPYQAKRGYMKTIKRCLLCGNEFLVYPCLKDKRKFCSHRCANRNITDEKREKLRSKMKLIRHSGNFKKGFTPWNKGKWFGQIENNKNCNWKGDNAKKLAMHTWVERRKGKAKEHKCEMCENQAEDWSNKDHKYKRVLDDYQSLCKKCHRKYDIKNNNWT